MKNEWDMFAAVQQRLAAGEQLVTFYFHHRLVHMTDEQRGIVHDEQGDEYELGEDFKQALQTCIRDKHISWGVQYRERTISFGPGINKQGTPDGTLTIGPDGEATIELM